MFEPIVRGRRVENDKPYIFLRYFPDIAQRSPLLVEAFHLENEQFLTDLYSVCCSDLSEAFTRERTRSDKYHALFASYDVRS